MTIWACNATKATFPERPWLTIRNANWMEGSWPWRLAGQQFRVPGEMNEAGCDVLFSPGGTLPWRCNLPAVTLSQNMLPFQPDEAALFGRWSLMRLKMRLLRYTQGRSFRRADGMIFLTQYAVTMVTKALGGLRCPIALIPHGIEPRFLQHPREARCLSNCSLQNPFRVLYVSISMPYKHQLEVAMAAKLLRDEGLPIELRFIGAPWGRYGQQLRTLLDQLDPKGEFLLWSGAEPFESLHEFYRQSDAFVFASSCENMPNILIEAMAACVPVVSSDRGPMPEVLGEAGLYFNPEDPASIADALRRLVLDAPLRANLAGLARARAQDYSWERCANQTLEFIAQVARRDHGIGSSSTAI